MQSFWWMLKTSTMKMLSFVCPWRIHINFLSFVSVFVHLSIYMCVRVYKYIHTTYMALNVHFSSIAALKYINITKKKELLERGEPLLQVYLMSRR